MTARAPVRATQVGRGPSPSPALGLLVPPAAIQRLAAQCAREEAGHLLTAPDAADVLGISVEAFERCVAPTIPSTWHRVLKQEVYYRDDLLRWHALFDRFR